MSSLGKTLGGRLKTGTYKYFPSVLTFLFPLLSNRNGLTAKIKLLREGESCVTGINQKSFNPHGLICMWSFQCEMFRPFMFVHSTKWCHHSVLIWVQNLIQSSSNQLIARAMWLEQQDFFELLTRMSSMWYLPEPGSNPDPLPTICISCQLSPPFSSTESPLSRSLWEEMEMYLNVLGKCLVLFRSGCQWFWSVWRNVACAQVLTQDSYCLCWLTS